MAVAEWWRERLREQPRIGPCPLSKCSLEVVLSLASIGQALWFLLAPEGMQLRSYVLNLSAVDGVVIPLSWSATLLFVGVFQGLTIKIRFFRVAADWAAILSGFAWIYVGMSLYIAGLILLTWTCILMVGANFYAAVLFKR